MSQKFIIDNVPLYYIICTLILYDESFHTTDDPITNTSWDRRNVLNFKRIRSRETIHLFECHSVQKPIDNTHLNIKH